MAKTGKKFSFPQLRLPPEVGALAKLWPDLKRRFRLLSPEQQAEIRQVQQLRRELRLREELLDDKHGGRWWDPDPPVSPVQPAPKKTAPSPVPTAAPTPVPGQEPLAFALATASTDDEKMQVRGKDQKRIHAAVLGLFKNGRLPAGITAAELVRRVFDWERKQAREQKKAAPPRELRWRAADTYIENHQQPD